MHGQSRRYFEVEHGGLAQPLALARPHGGASVIEIGEQRWPFAARPLGGHGHDIQLGPQRLRLDVFRRGERVAVFGPEGTAVLRDVDAIAHAGEAAADAGRLSAPMPGKVVAFLASPGQSVARGQALAVMEAMKMEHTLHAPRDGVVAEWLYAVGDQVAEGNELLRLVDQEPVGLGDGSAPGQVGAPI